jgi:hypothetical protein
LETKYESEQPVISTGSWTDNGDGTLSITVTDASQNQTEIKFKVSKDLLVTDTYPSFYGDAGINMKRLLSSTPAPASTSTPLPTTNTPTSKPSLPICGSAALICAIWLAWKHR